MGRRVGDVEFDARGGGYAEQIVEEFLIVGYGQWAWHRCLPVVPDDSVFGRTTMREAATGAGERTAFCGRSPACGQDRIVRVVHYWPQAG
ncbi:hypothetical protein GCM10011574_03680 [Microbispora bryophytorum]|uniref:Uncharacterized protein n=1 Tax=Microbispora bryophytorum TaxID=1460882 RepID=A0A8H9GX14_9ACTN|nr:hypothetical protein GCM10011574_03680 [Microbispora bryophytorum]